LSRDIDLAENKEEGKFFILEGDKGVKVISKKCMEDADLLVNVHNSLVLSFMITLVSL